jgi:hypothetical protein
MAAAARGGIESMADGSTFTNEILAPVDTCHVQVCGKSGQDKNKE